MLPLMNCHWRVAACRGLLRRWLLQLRHRFCRSLLTPLLLCAASLALRLYGKPLDEAAWRLVGPCRVAVLQLPAKRHLPPNPAERPPRPRRSGRRAALQAATSVNRAALPPAACQRRAAALAPQRRRGSRPACACGRPRHRRRHGRRRAARRAAPRLLWPPDAPPRRRPGRRRRPAATRGPPCPLRSAQQTGLGAAIRGRPRTELQLHYDFNSMARSEC